MYRILHAPNAALVLGLALLTLELHLRTGWTTYACAIVLGLGVGASGAAIMATLSWQTSSSHAANVAAFACKALVDATGRAVGSFVKAAVPSPWEPAIGVCVGIVAIGVLALWPSGAPPHDAGAPTRHSSSRKGSDNDEEQGVELTKR